MPQIPLISVILPVFNAQSYVGQAVASVLAQTQGDFELLLIDDGSTDTSGRLLRHFASADPRIRLIARENRGLTASLNEGLSLAQGKYIARMDADDVCRPTRFEKQAAFLRDNPACVAVGSQVILIDPYDSPLYQPQHCLNHEQIEQQLLSGVGWAIVHPAAMMLRTAVLEAGSYRPGTEPSEDLDLFLRLAERGKLANLPEVLLDYRQHLQSANHTRAAEQNQRKRRIITEAYQRRGLPMPQDWVPPVRKLLSRRSEIDMWGWTALKHGNARAARRHALSLIRQAPFSSAAWRLMFCTIRGH